MYSRDELLKDLLTHFDPTQGTVGVFACVCGGATFSSSTGEDTISWDGFTFDSITSEEFLNKLKEIFGV